MMQHPNKIVESQDMHQDIEKWEDCCDTDQVLREERNKRVLKRARKTQSKKAKVVPAECEYASIEF